jgi:hypothetical protein
MSFADANTILVVNTPFNTPLYINLDPFHGVSHDTT